MIDYMGAFERTLMNNTIAENGQLKARIAQLEAERKDLVERALCYTSPEGETLAVAVRKFLPLQEQDNV